MRKINKYLMAIATICGFLVFAFQAEARTDDPQKEKGEKAQRVPTQVFDFQWNTVSNFEFPATNYGILFLDIPNNLGGGYWPRGSLNQYVFGGGIWFAAQKWIPADSTKPNGDTVHYRKLNKICEVTYNPSSGVSWMVPGRISDGDLVDNAEIKKYRSYFSTDIRPSDGEPLNPDDGPNWPIWDASENPEDTLKYDRYFGYYIQDENERNLDQYPKGPAFISGEDIFSAYKDTDLNYYEGGVEYRRNLGYPMRLQFEQYIYSWGFGDYKDFIFIRYELINMSNDTLWDCWLAPVMDVDIARAPNTAAGAANDFARYYDEDPDLNLALQWTRDDPMEKGYGFGYLGFDFLESPAIHMCESKFDTTIDGNTETWCQMCVEKDTVVVTDPDGGNPRDSIYCAETLAFPEDLVGFPRSDRRWYENQYQLGLQTFRRWPIDEDKQEDEQRYEYLSSEIIEEGEGEAGDYRFLMATGPFNVMPGDTVRTVVGMILANPAVEKDATGETEDVEELVRKDKFAQRVYDNNFQAPKPPEKASIFKWSPLNHGVKLEWDSTAEISKDKYERGLDFLGYRLYRARRTDLDTFDVDEITPSMEYTSGKGPFGWKQIAQWELPTPFRKSQHRASMDTSNQNMPYIDSMKIVGPEYYRNGNNEMVVDTFAIKVMRIAKGLITFGPDGWVWRNMKHVINNFYQGRQWDRDTTLNVFIHSVDTSLLAKPWGPYLNERTNPDDFPMWYDPYNPEDPENHNFLIDSVLLGTVYLNRALLNYNPLYWKKVTVTVDPADTAGYAELPNRKDTNTHVIYLTDSYRTVNVDGSPRLVMDQLQPVDVNKAMTDTNLVRNALDSIYSYIQRGMVSEIKFHDFEQREDVINDCIVPYMREATDGRMYVDLGDDNRSGSIEYNANPVKTEKLINNVPYYYKLLSYDEGDFTQPTPSKLNAGFENLPNVKECYPRASKVMNPPKMKVTYVDSARIGGLYNFEFFAIDPQRVRQLFSGHTLELEFEPYWYYSVMTIPVQDGENRNVPYGLYQSMMTLRDLTDDNKILFRGRTYLEQISGRPGVRGGFTENSQSWVVDFREIEDTIADEMIKLPNPYHDTVITRSSKISAGDFKEPGYWYMPAFRQPAYGAMSFSFNYTAQQYGGLYRPDSTSLYPPREGDESPIIEGDATVPIAFMTDVPKGDLITYYDSNLVYRTQPVAMNVYGRYLATSENEETGQISWQLLPEFGTSRYGSFNSGPAHYLVEFKAGGLDTLNLKSGATPAKDYICPYLSMEVKNTINFKRPSLKGGDSVIVDYPLPIEHMKLDTLNFKDEGWAPSPVSLGLNTNDFIGKYNLHSYGYINAEGLDAKHFKLMDKYARPGDFDESEFSIKRAATPLGEQGRYYTTGVSMDGQDTVFFANIFLASGSQFVFDYARNRTRSVDPEWNFLNNETLDRRPVEFEPGDKVVLKTDGGALGFPMPGAKVRVYVDSNVVEKGEYTDDLLDQITVSPNPYYITHQAQASPYDAKIYFNRLPESCTIDVYTVTGDHIVELKHDEYSSSQPDRIGIQVWDLLTKNRQRVESQTLVAVISTPNGAQTVKKFSVVVGGFRLVPEDN